MPDSVKALRQLEHITPRPNSAYGRFCFLHPTECDISVIVPAYNTEKYVGECLDSILAQHGARNVAIELTGAVSSLPCPCSRAIAY